MLLASADAYNSNRAVQSFGSRDPLWSWIMHSCTARLSSDIAVIETKAV